KGMVAIFTYNLAVAKKNFEDADVVLRTLTNYDRLIDVAKEEEYIKASAMDSLAKWRENPEKWSEERMNQ
ncbi:MAG: orotate phosphoribosyltransferase, partial [Bacteroidales bacterium]|nr:orotate phosphoribosyltransferase [Bacteroidales bacterium]